MKGRHLIASLLIAIFIFGSAAGFAAKVNPEDIYISDPVSQYVRFGESTFFAVNIKNFEQNTKLYVSISQLFSTVVEEEVLKIELPVSKLQLIAPPNQASDRKVVFKTAPDSEEADFAKNVTETIEKYFKLKAEMESKVKGKSEEYSYWRTKYQLLFEKQVFMDVIQSPSYHTSLNTLSPGVYIVRLLDENGHLVKELQFEVIEEQNRNELPIPVLVPRIGYTN